MSCVTKGITTLYMNIFIEFIPLSLAYNLQMCLKLRMYVRTVQSNYNFTLSCVIMHATRDTCKELPYAMMWFVCRTSTATSN